MRISVHDLQVKLQALGAEQKAGAEELEKAKAVLEKNKADYLYYKAKSKQTEELLNELQKKLMRLERKLQTLEQEFKDKSYDVEDYEGRISRRRMALNNPKKFMLSDRTAFQYNIDLPKFEEILTQTKTRVNELRSEISNTNNDHYQQKEAVSKLQSEKEQATAMLAQIEAQLPQSQSRLEELQQQQSSFSDQIDQAEAELDEAQKSDDGAASHTPDASDTDAINALSEDLSILDPSMPGGSDGGGAGDIVATDIDLTSLDDALGRSDSTAYLSTPPEQDAITNSATANLADSYYSGFSSDISTDTLTSQTDDHQVDANQDVPIENLADDLAQDFISPSTDTAPLAQQSAGLTDIIDTIATETSDLISSPKPDSGLQQLTDQLSAESSMSTVSDPSRWSPRFFSPMDSQADSASGSLDQSFSEHFEQIKNSALEIKQDVSSFTQTIQEGASDIAQTILDLYPAPVGTALEAMFDGPRGINKEFFGEDNPHTGNLLVDIANREEAEKVVSLDH